MVRAAPIACGVAGYSEKRRVMGAVYKTWLFPCAL